MTYTMSVEEEEIKQLYTLAQYAHSSSDVQLINSKFETFVKKYPNNSGLLFKFNEFRISNISKLPKTRPHVLVGGPFSVIYPNMHTFSLFECADIICLAPNKSPYPFHSSIHCGLSDLFVDTLKKLPPGFEPDFYWDNQVEQFHYIPPGIQIAPFPIVASVCHTYLHKSIEHVCELFDLIVANPKSYVGLLEKKFPGKIINLPFGLNWASFHKLLHPCWEKSIDVSVTISGTDSPIFPTRNKVIDLVKKFKEKHGHRFSIELFDPMPYHDYIKTLQRSLITINAVGVHGPYNYRTVEAMCSGSMVFQLDCDGPYVKNRFSDLFIDGEHGFGFTFDNFEEKLLYYLENREEAVRIAKNGFAFLSENYSYKKLFLELVEIIKAKNIKIPRNTISSNAYHHADMIYYYQSNSMHEALSYCVLDEAVFPQWIRCNNMMVLARLGKEQQFASLLLKAFSAHELSSIQHYDSWSLCLKFFEEAQNNIPTDYTWIVQWNFFLLSIEHGKADRKAAENLLEKLEKAKPQPFDELKVVFKYYILSESFPEYRLGSDAYLKLNIDLLKDIGDPFKRASHHLDYAIKALSYILGILQ